MPTTRTVADWALVTEAATLLAGAERPIIIMGDGIAMSDAQAELTHVAELLGADVWGANSSEVNFDDAHPLFRGNLGHMFGHHSGPLVAQADAVLIVGTYVFPEVFPSLGDVFAADAKIVHIDLDAYEIAKNFPVDLGLVSDPKLTLAALGSATRRAGDAGRARRRRRPDRRPSRSPRPGRRGRARRRPRGAQDSPAPRLGVHGGARARAFPTTRSSSTRPSRSRPR